jgi:hypothetical protein
VCASSVNIDCGTLSPVKAFIGLETQCQNLVIAFEEVAVWRMAVSMNCVRNVQKNGGMSCGDMCIVW